MRGIFERMNLANLFEGYADTALAAWNDPKSKSADQKSSKFYLQSYLHYPQPASKIISS